MVEAQRRRVEEQMTLLIESMDKFHLRKMQVQIFYVSYFKG